MSSPQQTRPSIHRYASIVAALALALVVGPALAAVRIPTRFVPGDAAIASAANNQLSPFLSQGGSTVLAIWSDNRANSTGGYEGETSQDIYGMRFDAAGNAIDALPFAIAAGRAAQTVPRAAWNGTNWLVVFESYDVGGTGYYQQSLEALRVAPTGQVLDPKPIKLFNMTPVGSTWAVASDGSGWVVVNQSTSSSGDLVASRISAAGVLLDPGPRSIVTGTYYLRGGLQLAYANGVFLLAYEESMTGSDPTTAIRFDSNLTLLDPAPFGLLGSTIKRLVSNGIGFYAVWNEQLPDFTIAVKGTRINTAGQKLDGSGVNISGPNEPSGTAVTSAVWDGTYWKAIWGSLTDARVARVSTAGVVLDPGGVLVVGAKTGNTASAGSGSVQVAWSEYTTNNSDVYTSNISSLNLLGPTRTASLGAPSQWRPDVATNGSGYMVVYRSSTAGRNRILAQPLDSTGNPLTAEPIELDAADGTDYPGYPAIAWNGSVYMAAWNNGSGVVMRRLQSNGAVIDPAPMLVMSSGFGPVDIAALNGDFLIVGLRCGINCQYINPIAMRVRGSDGALLNPSPIQINGTYSSTPTLAVLGGRWLLVWRDNASHDDCYASTAATFIDAFGVKAPEFTVHGPYSSCGGNGIFGIGLAASNNVALMVQSQELTSGVENDLLFRQIDPNGTVHPYVNITPWSDDQYRPRVSWDGSYFVITWQDQRSALADSLLEQLDARSDLYGMRVSESGAVIDPQGFVFSNSPIAEAYPTVVSSNGVTLFAASFMRNESPLANYRVGYELYGTGNNPWPSPRATALPMGGDIPLAVSFNSAGTTDPNGSIASYSWDFGDGASSPDPNPLHTYSTPGPFLATLTVTDNAGATAMQELMVRAISPNLLPVAIARQDRTHGPVPLDVTFYADRSYDPDGVLGNIKWSFSDGSETWGSTGYKTFYEPGTYQVTLTVYDARGGTGTANLTVTADPPLPPLPPSDLSAIPFSPEWINMTWTDNSNNEDGFRVERCSGNATTCSSSSPAWSQIAEVGPNINYYGDTGLPPTTTYSYRVRAFNVTAQSAYSNISTATTQTYLPIASNIPSVLHGSAPLDVTFDGRGSYDPDGTVVSWHWDFGDGATANGALVSHTYSTVGWMFSSLTVTDNAGATATEYVSIEVKDGNTNSPATADAGTALGSIFSGSYLNTQTEDNSAEVLIEAQSGSTPSTRKSQLEHKWSITVAAGGMQKFYLDAWHTPNSEGDDFIFEYSRNNTTWTPMVTVTKTADNSSLQSYSFPSDVTGQLWVRVRDLDRTAGRGSTDKVFIDHMFVASSLSNGHVGEVAPVGLADGTAGLTVTKTIYGQLTLSWGVSCVATDIDYGVYQGKLGSFQSHVPVQCSTSGATTATIQMPAGNAYFLVVPSDTYYEGRYGTASSGAAIPAGPQRCWPAAVTAGCP
ncbi:MAG: PKD domain-containing protein [Acidobacteriota bacterium]